MFKINSLKIYSFKQFCSSVKLVLMIIRCFTGKQNNYCMIKHTKFNVIIVRCGKIFHDLIKYQNELIMFKAIVLFLMFECAQSFKILGIAFLLLKYSKLGYCEILLQIKIAVFYFGIFKNVIISVMEMLNVQKIILKCRFVAQETFIIISIVTVA